MINAIACCSCWVKISIYYMVCFVLHDNFSIFFINYIFPIANHIIGIKEILLEYFCSCDNYVSECLVIGIFLTFLTFVFHGAGLAGKIPLKSVDVHFLFSFREVIDAKLYCVFVLVILQY